MRLDDFPWVISRPYGPGLIEACCRSPAEARLRWISRPYGPGLIEAEIPRISHVDYCVISRPYGPGLIEAQDHCQDQCKLLIDFPALWAGPH